MAGPQGTDCDSMLAPKAVEFEERNLKSLDRCRALLLREGLGESADILSASNQGSARRPRGFCAFVIARNYNVAPALDASSVLFQRGSNNDG